MNNIKFLKVIIFVILPVAALGFMAVIKSDNAIDKVAPDFSLADTANKQVSLSSFKGKYVLIDFWASWCKDCRIENKNLVKAYKRFKNPEFDILSVSLDVDRDNWIKTIGTDNLAWPHHVSDMQKWQSPVVKLYNVREIPQTFLIDKEGKIIAEGLMGLALEKKLAELFPTIK